MKKLSLCPTIVFLICCCTAGHAQILTESFDAVTYPPVGWTNVQISGAASPGNWQRVSTGTNPSATPHSGAGMSYYNTYSWSGGNAADLSTPLLDFSSGSFAVSFWMYRDAGQSAKYDSVSVYVDVNSSSAGGTRLGVINRSRTLSPAEAADGWYLYTFNIPGTYNTATNHLIFKATSDFGNRIYIDDISVYALTPPADLNGISASDSSVCSGNSLTLYAAGIDGTVKWYTDTCGGTLAGIGDSLTVTPSQTTTYYALNFNNNLYSTNCAALEITVHYPSAISFSDTICTHEIYTLADGSTADTTGIYTVTVPSVHGCDSTVTVSLTVQAEISGSFTQSICPGDSLLFNGTYYNQPGTYSDTLTSVSGCDSILFLNLSVFITDTPVITENGLTLSAQDFAAYQWIKDGADIDGANNQTYTATENGLYTVETIDSNGCRSLSAGVNVIGLGLSNQTARALQIFPNPVRNVLMFSILPVNTKTEVQIYNVTGQLVLKKILAENTLPVQHLSAGVYTLLTFSAGTLQRHIFVKE